MRRPSRWRGCPTSARAAPRRTAAPSSSSTPSQPSPTGSTSRTMAGSHARRMHSRARTPRRPPTGRRAPPPPSSRPPSRPPSRATSSPPTRRSPEWLPSAHACLRSATSTSRARPDPSVGSCGAARPAPSTPPMPSRNAQRPIGHSSCRTTAPTGARPRRCWPPPPGTSISDSIAPAARACSAPRT